VKKSLAEFLGVPEENIFLFAKGRVGLYALLKALKLTPGDEVLMPGYTCMVVPSAASFLGLSCKYIDIDPDTYNIDTAQLPRQTTKATRALIVQHTYGIPAPMDAVMQWSRENNIPVIEDCCHAFGSRYQGRLCGTFGIGAFFSGQWNKPFSTGLGGVLVVHEPKLAAAVKRIHDSARDVPFTENILLKMQIMAYNTLVTPRTNAFITKLYRVLSRMGIAAGSSSNAELAVQMPSNYLKKIAPCQLREGHNNLRSIKEDIAVRRRNTAYYSEELKKAGFATLCCRDDIDTVILRYPVRVANKQEVLSRALAHNIEIGSWFEVPLHPAGTNMVLLQYYTGMCPEAEKAAREVINLPTQSAVTAQEAHRVIEFLKRYARPVT